MRNRCILPICLASIALASRMEDLEDSREPEDDPIALEAEGGIHERYYYSQALHRTDRKLKAFLMRVTFSDVEGGEEDIPIEGNLEYSMESTRKYFEDSSWGKISFDFDYTPNYKLDIPSATSTLGDIWKEADERLKADGFTWCDGMCTRPDAGNPDGKYDLRVIVMRKYNSDHKWAGVASVSYPTMATHYGTSPAVMEHEIGHNFGLHHMDRERRAMACKNTIDYKVNELCGTKESRMSGGGAYQGTEESGYEEGNFYKKNGHFGPVAKTWFGWIENEQIIELWPTDLRGENVLCGKLSECRQRLQSVALNAYDRPDIVPGSTVNGSDLFTIQIPLPSTDEHHRQYIFVYYRTSYFGPEAGLSTQYCQRKEYQKNPMGGSMVCWDYDALPYFSTNQATPVAVGNSYVVYPSMKAVEGGIGCTNQGDVKKGWYYAWEDWPWPIVTVDERSSDWDNCDDDYVCPEDSDISLKVSVDFVDLAAREYEAYNELFWCQNGSAEKTEISLRDGRAMIHIDTGLYGPFGRGLSSLKICPGFGGAVVAWIYDHYPDVQMTTSSPLGYGAQHRLEFQPTKYRGVNAIKLIQNREKSLSFAEVVVLTIDGRDISSEMTCYSWPIEGYWYNGNKKTGIDPSINDGDLNSFSHSGVATPGTHDICTLRKSAEIASIKVYPRNSWWDRAEDVSIELYNSFEFEEDNPVPVGKGLLYSADLELYREEGQMQYKLVELPEGGYMDQVIEAECTTLPFEFFYGNAWVILEDLLGENPTGTVEVEMPECSVDACVDGTISYTPENGAMQCLEPPAPENLAFEKSAYVELEDSTVELTKLTDANEGSEQYFKEGLENFVIDLGADYMLSSFEVQFWYICPALAYTVQIKQDGGDWETILEDRNCKAQPCGAGYNCVDNMKNGLLFKTARYVKLTNTKPDTTAANGYCSGNRMWGMRYAKVWGWREPVSMPEIAEGASCPSVRTNKGHACACEWSFEGRTYQGCANPDKDRNGPWCGIVDTAADAGAGSLNGNARFDYCRAKPLAGRAALPTSTTGSKGTGGGGGDDCGSIEKPKKCNKEEGCTWMRKKCRAEPTPPPTPAPVVKTGCAAESTPDGCDAAENDDGEQCFWYGSMAEPECGVKDLCMYHNPKACRKNKQSCKWSETYESCMPKNDPTDYFGEEMCGEVGVSPSSKKMKGIELKTHSQCECARFCRSKGAEGWRMSAPPRGDAYEVKTCQCFKPVRKTKKNKKYVGGTL